MPTQSDRVHELRDAAGPGEIPYISKSRISKWLTCEEKFNFSYLKGYKEPATRYTRRGTNVHETYEAYYEAATTFSLERDEFPTVREMIGFLPPASEWATYTAPYIANFLAFEVRRMQAATFPAEWLPVAVEAEGWLEDPLDYGDEAIPWMGYADAIYHASAFPEITGDDGYVVVDFKTGKVPNEKYRDEGIYLEGEYYAMLFEDEWEIAGVAGYYPKTDDVIVSPLSEERQATIRQVVHEMQAVSGTNPAHLEITEQPLCYWGEDGKCPYYDICDSRWGEPLKHADRTREMVDAGYSDSEIARELGCSVNHVSYAKRKLGL